MGQGFAADDGGDLMHELLDFSTVCGLGAQDAELCAETRVR
jgi:hypothetical protein